MLKTKNITVVALAAWTASFFLPLFGGGGDALHGWVILWVIFDPISLILFILSPWMFLSFLKNFIFIAQAYLMAKGGRGSAWIIMMCLSINIAVVIKKPLTQRFENIGITKDTVGDFDFGPASWVWLLSFLVLLVAAARDADTRGA
jgi:hypothetical protein